MAWSTIEHNCGHTSRRQLYGKSSKREWIIEQEEQNPCPDCAADNSNLKGSPKQVAWAEQIREKALTGLSNSHILNALRHIDQKNEGISVPELLKTRYPDESKRDEAMAEMVEVSRQALEGITEAKDWIDARYDEAILIEGPLFDHIKS